MITRLLVLVVALGVGNLAVTLVQRRRGKPDAWMVPGLTLVTSKDCVLCPRAKTALERAAVPHRVLDISEVALPGIRSVPTLLWVGDGGEVEWRRSGRAAVIEAARLAAS